MNNEGGRQLRQQPAFRQKVLEEGMQTGGRIRLALQRQRERNRNSSGVLESRLVVLECHRSVFFDQHADSLSVERTIALRLLMTLRPSRGASAVCETKLFTEDGEHPVDGVEPKRRLVALQP